jgi:hypothetical protein
VVLTVVLTDLRPHDRVLVAWPNGRTFVSEVVEVVTSSTADAARVKVRSVRHDRREFVSWVESDRVRSFSCDPGTQPRLGVVEDPRSEESEENDLESESESDRDRYAVEPEEDDS